MVVVMHNMQREAPRTLHTLSAAYQRGVEPAQYEVVVVENGSRQRLDADAVRASGPNVAYHYLEDPPPSPGYAINFGVAQARGELLGVMIDGACLLSPGVLTTALRAFQAFPQALVLTRYFYLGPEMQNVSMRQGYGTRVEDQLLTSIDFPSNGYRLFEIATPHPAALPTPNSWFHRIGESCCLFFRKTAFQQVGGCDLRFNIPGGGLLNYDLCRALTLVPGTPVVQLLGEGTFHQIHGGTTTNTSVADKDAKVLEYKEQYKAIRGEEFCMPPLPHGLWFVGAMRSRCAPWMRHTIPDTWPERWAA